MLAENNLLEGSLKPLQDSLKALSLQSAEKDQKLFAADDLAKSFETMYIHANRDNAELRRTSSIAIAEFHSMMIHQLDKLSSEKSKIMAVTSADALASNAELGAIKDTNAKMEKMMSELRGANDYLNSQINAITIERDQLDSSSSLLQETVVTTKKELDDIKAKYDAEIYKVNMIAARSIKKVEDALDNERERTQVLMNEFGMSFGKKVADIISAEVAMSANIAVENL